MIRPADARDAVAVSGLWNWMIRETLATFTTDEKPPEAIAAMIVEREGAFIVAEVAGAVAGFATFGPFRAGPGYAATREVSILVAPDAHGQGLGRALMTELEHAARAQGVHVLVAAISGGNQQAVGFHGALGFERAGVLPEVGRKAGQWLDLVLMQKNLSAPA